MTDYDAREYRVRGQEYGDGWAWVIERRDPDEEWVLVEQPDQWTDGMASTKEAALRDAQEAAQRYAAFLADMRKRREANPTGSFIVPFTEASPPAISPADDPHTLVAKALDPAQAKRLRELEDWGNQVHAALDGQDLGHFDETPARIASLKEQYEDAQATITTLEIACDHHKMFWQKAEERERRLKEQLEAVRRWFMDEPWKGDFDRSSFGGHDYTPAERAIGYGTHRDPRFLPPLLAELAPEPSKTP